MTSSSSASDPHHSLPLSFRLANSNDLQQYWDIYVTGYPFVDRWDYSELSRLWKHEQIWKQVFVAELNDQLIAIASYLRFSSFCYIFGVVVHPSWRGKGIGRQLISALETHLKQEYNCSTISISVMLSNYPALSLYSSLHYQIRTLLVLLAGSYTPLSSPSIDLITRPPSEEDWAVISSFSLSSPLSALSVTDWKRLCKHSQGSVILLASESLPVAYLDFLPGEPFYEIRTFCYSPSHLEVLLSGLAAYPPFNEPLALYVDVRESTLLELLLQGGMKQDSFLSEVFLQKSI